MLVINIYYKRERVEIGYGGAHGTNGRFGSFPESGGVVRGFFRLVAAPVASLLGSVEVKKMDFGFCFNFLIIVLDKSVLIRV